MRNTGCSTFSSCPARLVDQLGAALGDALTAEQAIKAQQWLTFVRARRYERWLWRDSAPVVGRVEAPLVSSMASISPVLLGRLHAVLVSEI